MLLNFGKAPKNGTLLGQKGRLKFTSGLWVGPRDDAVHVGSPVYTVWLLLALLHLATLLTFLVTLRAYLKKGCLELILVTRKASRVARQTFRS